MAGKEAQVGTSGISRLSKSDLKQHEGKCVGIVEGKVMFSGRDASKVLQQLMEYKESKDKIFSCIPISSLTLVK